MVNCTLKDNFGTMAASTLVSVWTMPLDDTSAQKSMGILFVCWKCF